MHYLLQTTDAKDPEMLLLQGIHVLNSARIAYDYTMFYKDPVFAPRFLLSDQFRIISLRSLSSSQY